MRDAMSVAKAELAERRTDGWLGPSLHNPGSDGASKTQPRHPNALGTSRGQSLRSRHRDAEGRSRASTAPNLRYEPHLLESKKQPSAMAVVPPSLGVINGRRVFLQINRRHPWSLKSLVCSEHVVDSGVQRRVPSAIANAILIAPDNGRCTFARVRKDQSGGQTLAQQLPELMPSHV